MTHYLLEDFSLSFSGSELNNLKSFISSAFTSLSSSLSQGQSSISFDIKPLPDLSLAQLEPIRNSVVRLSDDVYLIDSQNNLCLFPRLDLGCTGQNTIYVSPLFNPRFFVILIDYLLHRYALSQGASLCHCSAFSLDNTTYICPAWRNVGKTSLVIEALANGAHYLADDWLILFANGHVAVHPKRISIQSYNLPHLVERLPGVIRTTSSANANIDAVHYMYRYLFQDFKPDLDSFLSSYIDFCPYLPDQLHSNISVHWLMSDSTQAQLHSSPTHSHNIAQHVSATLRVEQEPFRLAEQIYSFIDYTYADFYQRILTTEVATIHSFFGALSSTSMLRIPNDTHPTNLYNTVIQK